MAEENFSPDVKTPPKHFRPGPGQTGVAAALRGPKGQGSSPRPARSPGRPGQTDRIPHPDNPPEPPADFRHLAMGMFHQNAVGLGRDQSIGIWLTRNGYLTQMGKPGMQPFDWFLDS